jgi:hypothetical protein
VQEGLARSCKLTGIFMISSFGYTKSKSRLMRSANSQERTLEIRGFLLRITHKCSPVDSNLIGHIEVVLYARNTP